MQNLKSFATAAILAVAATCTGSAFAAGPSAASLKGSYTFHLTSTKEAYWSNSKNCGSGDSKYTAYSDNWTAYTELIRGVATFDGKGGVTITYTDVHQVDQDQSNASIVITCTGNNSWTTSQNNVVFEPPAPGTGSGAYSVEADGSGTMTLSVHLTGSTKSETVVIDLDLGGAASGGIAPTVLLRAPDSSEDGDFNTGIAIHQ
jgi:hypothetical protein